MTNSQREIKGLRISVAGGAVKEKEVRIGKRVIKRDWERGDE